jgi:hypothetical protein
LLEEGGTEAEGDTGEEEDMGVVVAVTLTSKGRLAGKGVEAQKEGCRVWWVGLGRDE